MRRSALGLAILLALSAGFSGCAHHQAELGSQKAEAQPASAAAEESPSDPWQQSRTYYQILLGQLAQQRGYDDVAMNNLLTAAESTSDASLAKQAFGVAMRARQFEAAERAAKIWLSGEPNDTEALAMMLIAQWQSGKLEAVDEGIDQVLAKTADDERSRLATVQQLSRMLGGGSIAVFSARATQSAHPEWTWLALAMTAKHFGDTNHALMLLNMAMNAAPDYLRAPLVKAEMQMEWDKASALHLLQTLYQQHPQDPDVHLALSRLLYQLGEFEQSLSVLAKAPNANDKEVRYLTAVSTHMAGEWQKGLPLLQQLIADNIQPGIAAWLCGQAFERLEQWDNALKCYRQVNPEHSQLTASVHASVDIFLRQKKPQQALNVIDSMLQVVDEKTQGPLWVIKLETLMSLERYQDAKRLVDALPANVRALSPVEALALAIYTPDDGAVLLDNMRVRLAALPEADEQWVLTFSGRLNQLKYYDEAYALLDEYLLSAPESVELLYARALLAAQLGRPEHSAQDLRQLLTIDPNHIDALNALGYTLSDMNKDLAEANMLVERAYQARPTSAAILDSMGWLRFRQGQHKEALKFLKRAWALDGDAEIATHYGEALWQAGEKQKAKAILYSARKLNPEHVNLKATIKRLMNE